MEMGQIRDLSVEEIWAREKEIRKEMFNLRFQGAAGRIENPARIRVLKRDLARLLTALQEKKKA